MQEAQIPPLPFARFGQLLPPPVFTEADTVMRRASEAMRGRTLWNINTTLSGGGVAEILSASLPYVRDTGIACRWVMMDATPDYLEVTKRLHNWLHGFRGDGGPLGAQQRRCYDEVIASNAERLLPMIAAGDVVIVHDPQPAGLVPLLKQAGAHVIWRCHIGIDSPNDFTRHAWRFLLPDVSAAGAYIFSRPHYLWDGLDPRRLHVIQPSINPFSAKNQELGPSTVDAILKSAGIVAGQAETPATYVRTDALAGEVTHSVTLPGGGEPVPEQAPFLLQAARWDRLKDHEGVMSLFAKHIADTHPDIHLVIAGPFADGVSDDPEGAEAMQECVAAYRGLDAHLKPRVHLVCTPMEDMQETEAIVNALQRRAAIVFQKSQAEGFGLVVAEAMWKRRPVVASRVGGIQDQIEHGQSGVLIDDPSDGAAFADAAVSLLDDPRRAEVLGRNAHERVLHHYLSSRELAETMRLVLATTG